MIIISIIIIIFKTNINMPSAAFRQNEILLEFSPSIYKADNYSSIAGTVQGRQ